MTEAAPSLKCPANNTNVLVLDDDIALCRILHRMLTDERYTVETTQSVADALGAIEQKPFDVYVMDYKLPDGSGIDVAEWLRSKGSKAPIILITGYDPDIVGLRAKKLHISDFLEKPFSRATICDAVKKAISSQPANPLAAVASALAGGGSSNQTGDTCLVRLIVRGENWRAGDSGGLNTHSRPNC